MKAPQALDTDGIASTPGLAGYALALGISWVLVTVGSGVLAVRDLALLMDWAALVGVFALVAGPLGVLLVHVACERFDAQWIHVVVAGLVGSLAVVLADSLLFGELSFEFWRMALGVGACTAVARAAVIPLVPVVRLRFPAWTPAWRRVSLR